MNAAIKALHLRKAYQQNRVIEDLSLEVAEGERRAILAPSGCGKTTLLRLLAGLEKPDSGEIFIKSPVAYVFQEPRLLPAFTVLENVSAVLTGREKKKMAAEWLLKVGLQKEDFDKLPSEISGGMAQRVALARALSTQREIFFFDEPFKGLDEESKNALMHLLHQVLSEKTVLFVTHDEGEAQALGAHPLRFSKGIVLFSNGEEQSAKAAKIE